MGRIHTNLKRIFEKIQREKDYEPYKVIIEKFVTLVTYDDVYLMNKRMTPYFLRQNGEDMFIDCGGFGILISPKDEISIHT
jgi:hypothetical protein